MKNRKSPIKIFLPVILGIIITGILIIPLFIPYPTGKYTEKQLADSDSRFIMVDGLSVHYKMYGTGKTVYILLHGTLATTFTWRDIAKTLSEKGTVIAYDRPSFGLTSRPMADEFDKSSPYGYEAQVNLLIHFMDALNVKHAVLIGNSMGGAIACMAAEQYPKRFDALVLVDPVQSRHALPVVVNFLAKTPQLRHMGVFYIHNNIKKFGNFLYPLSWHDKSKIKQEYCDEYFKIFKIKNFEQGLWEFLVAARPLEKLLNPENIKIPTLVIAGDDDRVAGIEHESTGTQDLIQLSQKIRNSRLVVIPDCGHIPQEECPAAFLQAVREFVSDL
jgi:pimeloyl-ACP methyl ester carboxylesterase